MFQLDFINDDGEKTGQAGVPSEAQHMITARNRALIIARASGVSVLISRESTEGIKRPTLIIRPDGSAAAPLNMDDGCKASTGVTCFCPNCRAARRA